MDDEERQLWERYRSPDPSHSHQELFFRYVPWARAVARDVYRRVRISQVEWGDYAQNATIGLLEAMTRFDPGRGVDFMGYARARVRGAVFNGLRAFLQDFQHRDWQGRAEDRLGSWSTEGDDILGHLIDSVVGLGIGFLIDSAVQDDSYQLEEPSRVVERHQMNRALDAAISRLPDRERLVVAMHYQEYVPFVEIANLLGVTKGRVSQIHHAALTRIRESIAEMQSRGRKL